MFVYYPNFAVHLGRNFCYLFAALQRKTINYFVIRSRGDTNCVAKGNLQKPSLLTPPPEQDDSNVIQFSMRSSFIIEG